MVSYSLGIRPPIDSIHRCGVIALFPGEHRAINLALSDATLHTAQLISLVGQTGGRGIYVDQHPRFPRVPLDKVIGQVGKAFLGPPSPPRVDELESMSRLVITYD